MTPADKPEPVACPECGHLAGEESDLLTIAYMSGAYDERKARENGLRPTSDLAERQAEKVVSMLWPILGGDALGDTWHEIGDAILAALKEVPSDQG